MPADPANIGSGRRRQGATEPDRSDDSNRSLERSIADEAEQDAAGEAYDRTKTAGARSDAPPHQNVKPGTRLDLEQSETE